MKITAIKQQLRAEHRVNLFLDHTFFCSITKDQLLEAKLHVGKTISDKEKQHLEKQSDESKVYDRAVGYILRRPRSIQEMRNYLQFKKGIDVEAVDATISMLTSKGHLDDTRFTKWFVQQRIDQKKYGRKKIEQDLFAKGISSEVQREVLNTLLPQDNQKTIQALLQQWTSPEELHDHKAKQKFIRRLLSRGFGYEEVKNAINSFHE